MKKEVQENLRSWLSKKLKKRGHGAQIELAKALGVPQQSVGRMIKPQKGRSPRTITATEIAVMTDFFGEAPPLFSEFIPAADWEFYQLLSALSQKGKENLLALARVWLSQNPENFLPAPKRAEIAQTNSRLLST